MSRGYSQVHSKLIQDTSKISQLSSNGTTCVAKQHRLVPCRAHRCRALPQWEAAPGSPDEAWAMHVPKKNHSHPFTYLLWYRWCLHDCWIMCYWNELNSFRKPVDLGHCMWRIAAIMCDEYSVCPNSMERWKPYSSTLFTHFVLG